ncbi:MAG: hypothetical protein ACKO0Z_25040 [Betaproteobacteria bacterium]
MIYAGCLLILVGMLFLRRPSAFYVESSRRGVKTYEVTPAAVAGLACAWTGIVFNVTMLVERWM